MDSKKKNVIVVVPGLSGGGQERLAISTAEILNETYNSILVIFSDENIKYKTDIPIINLKAESKKTFLGKVKQQMRRIITLKKIIQKVDPLFVYSFGDTANITNVLTGGKNKKIISLRGYRILKRSFINSIIFKKADMITCISSGMKKKLIELYPYASTKTKVLYNGIDIKKVQTLSKKQKDKIILPETKRIVSVGRLTDVKGFRQLIRSFARLLKTETDISLIIIGEGKNKDDLLKLVRELEIMDNVYFMGFQTNPFHIMRECDVFVLSSIYEGFGNVIVEAMACQLPIISSSCLSGPAEILGSNNYSIQEITKLEYGLLVPSFNDDYSVEIRKEELLSEAMRIILNDKKLKYHYKKQSLIRANTFDLITYTDKLYSVINELIN